MLRRLWELDPPVRFTCPWNERTGTLVSMDDEGCSATVELDQVRDSEGKIIARKERLEWSVGTIVEVKRSKFSLKEE